MIKIWIFYVFRRPFIVKIKREFDSSCVLSVRMVQCNKNHLFCDSDFPTVRQLDGCTAKPPISFRNFRKWSQFWIFEISMGFFIVKTSVKFDLSMFRTTQWNSHVLQFRKERWGRRSEASNPVRSWYSKTERSASAGDEWPDNTCYRAPSENIEIWGKIGEQRDWK